MIKKVGARIIRDSRRDKTIEVVLKTKFGKVASSAPNGKSKGSFEAEQYHESIEQDVSFLRSLELGRLEFEKFSDLAKIENLVRNKIGANSLFALESCILKYLAKKYGEEAWQIINKKANPSMFLVGNIIGGGVHSQKTRKPDFQEFLMIPEAALDMSVKINRRAWKNAMEILKNIDRRFHGKLNDENAWETSLENEQVLILMQDIKENMMDEFGVNMHAGIDVAASSFFLKGNEKYKYLNPKRDMSRKEQIEYINYISKVYKLFYIEDPLEENDFEGFRKINKTGRMVVGDDLTASDLGRLKKAVKSRSINSVIIKPNQIGSLIEVAKVVRAAKKNKIKTVFSHRSGETDENILADLAYGFEADYFKGGVVGKERKAKLKRLVEIYLGK